MNQSLTRFFTDTFFLICILYATNIKAQFRFSPSDRSNEKNPTLTYSSSDGRQTVPRGVFHYSNIENNFGANYKLPSTEQINPLQMISDLMNTAVNAEQKTKQLSGAYLPMPFGLSPLNLQISQDGSTGISSRKSTQKVDEQKPSTSAIDNNPQIRRLFLNARTVCLHEGKSECDAALEHYERARLGKSPLDTRLNSQRASPDDPVDYVQTEMAKWLLPSLRDRLETIKTEESTSRSSRKRKSQESDEVVEGKSLERNVERKTRRNPFGNIQWNSPNSPRIHRL
ncbi:unnamed protein product, partial [Mesorhabditis belari]|uniref:Uncharacterized protein n=1 Tax=Mesorhabditis belari TaxID=2138241 RepID=A0AAF3ET89_9BILA